MLGWCPCGAHTNLIQCDICGQWHCRACIDEAEEVGGGYSVGDEGLIVCWDCAEKGDYENNE